MSMGLIWQGMYFRFTTMGKESKSSGWYCQIAYKQLKTQILECYHKESATNSIGKKRSSMIEFQLAVLIDCSLRKAQNMKISCQIKSKMPFLLLIMPLILILSCISALLWKCFAYFALNRDWPLTACNLRLIWEQGNPILFHRTF